MTLDFARRCAAKLQPWLESISTDVLLCGSVRRERPLPNDLDFVVVADVEPVKDMFGAVTGSIHRTRDAISTHCNKKGYDVEKAGPEYCCFAAAGVQVDIWLTTKEAYWSTVVCKTGSREHNVLLATRAVSMGLNWHPLIGLKRLGELLPSNSEAELYGHLRLPFIPPPEREGQRVAQIFNQHPINRR